MNQNTINCLKNCPIASVYVEKTFSISNMYILFSKLWHVFIVIKYTCLCCKFNIIWIFFGFSCFIILHISKTACVFFTWFLRICAHIFILLPKSINYSCYVCFTITLRLHEELQKLNLQTYANCFKALKLLSLV